jgi:hypothetical protein
MDERPRPDAARQAVDTPDHAGSRSDASQDQTRLGTDARARVAQLNEHPVVRYRDTLDLPSGATRDGQLDALATTVAADDPDMALEAVAFMSDTGRRDRTNAVLVETFASTHPDHAAVGIEAIADPTVKASLAENLAVRHPELARAAADAIPAGALQQRTLAEIAVRMAPTHPREAHAAARAISDRGLRDVTCGVVAEEIAAGPYPHHAFGPLAGVKDSELKNEARARVALGLAAAGKTDLANGLVKDIDDPVARARARVAVDQAITARSG